MKWGVVVFPGSNDDRDTIYALESVLGEEAVALWHQDTDLAGADAVVLPGGFSYGDYLRPGAMARFSPIMNTVVDFARSGGPVLGICNGFQILCEAGLLPGTLVRNQQLRFRCSVEKVTVERTDTAFSSKLEPGCMLSIPVKHGEGRYVADSTTLAQLEDEGRVVFRYSGSNPNGSTNDIAGVSNPDGNVVGLMPHPEHAVEPGTVGEDGAGLFRSARSWLAGRNNGGHP